MLSWWFWKVCWPSCKPSQGGNQCFCCLVCCNLLPTRAIRTYDLEMSSLHSRPSSSRESKSHARQVQVESQKVCQKLRVYSNALEKKREKPPFEFQHLASFSIMQESIACWIILHFFWIMASLPQPSLSRDSLHETKKHTPSIPSTTFWDAVIVLQRGRGSYVFRCF